MNNMTIDEAIKWLNETKQYENKCTNCSYKDECGACNAECQDVQDMAIIALEKISNIQKEKIKIEYMEIIIAQYFKEWKYFRKLTMLDSFELNRIDSGVQTMKSILEQIKC